VPIIEFSHTRANRRACSAGGYAIHAVKSTRNRGGLLGPGIRIRPQRLAQVASFSFKPIVSARRGPNVGPLRREIRATLPSPRPDLMLHSPSYPTEINALRGPATCEIASRASRPRAVGGESPTSYTHFGQRAYSGAAAAAGPLTGGCFCGLGGWCLFTPAIGANDRRRALRPGPTTAVGRGRPRAIRRRRDRRQRRSRPSTTTGQRSSRRPAPEGRRHRGRSLLGLPSGHERLHIDHT
jgi:hypothetical protein